MSSKDLITYHALSLLSRWLNRLSRRDRNRIGERLGAMAFNRVNVRKDEAVGNLRKAFPDRSDAFIHATLKELHRHYGHMLVDALCGATLVRGGMVTVDGRETLEKVYDSGKGAIVMSGHLGNWELIPQWLAGYGYEIVTVAQRQKNRGADQFFMEYRRRTGTAPIHPKSPASEMLTALRAGKILGLATDQDAGKRGEFVPFFGRLASSPRGPGVFHRKTGAPIITAFCLREPDGRYRLRFGQLPNDDEGSATVMARFTAVLEEEVRQRPEQYFWFHRRWKTAPPKADS